MKAKNLYLVFLFFTFSCTHPKFDNADLIFWGNSHAMDIVCDTYRYYNNKLIPKQTHCLTGGNVDPEDCMLSPGTIVYQLGQRYNLRMIQIQPLLGETLWRNSVEDLDPVLDWEKIRRAY